MSWTRPDLPKIPTVYHTFRAKDADSDELVNYRVEDLTEDRFEDIIQHFTDYFADDEPLCENRKVSSSEVGMSKMKQFWHWCFAQKMSIVCFKEGSDEIVGANLLAVKTLAKFDWQKEETESPKEGDIMATLDYFTDNFDLFEHYGVDKYLTAFGLAVNRRYRGRGIATEILKARVPLCRAFGIKLTATIFTAAGSQYAAAKAGFKTNLEVTFDEFAEMGPKYTFPGIKSHSCKLMSLKVE